MQPFRGSLERGPWAVSAPFPFFIVFFVVVTIFYVGVAGGWHLILTYGPGWLVDVSTNEVIFMIFQFIVAIVYAGLIAEAAVYLNNRLKTFENAMQEAVVLANTNAEAARKDEAVLDALLAIPFIVYSAFSPPVKPQSFLLERCPGRPSDERIQTAIQNIGAVAHGDDLLVAMSRAVRVVPAGTDTLYRVFLSEINLTRHTRLHLAVRVAMNLVLIVYFLVTLPAFLWDVVGIRLLYIYPYVMHILLGGYFFAWFIADPFTSGKWLANMILESVVTQPATIAARMKEIVES